MLDASLMERIRVGAIQRVLGDLRVIVDSCGIDDEKELARCQSPIEVALLSAWRARAELRSRVGFFALGCCAEGDFAYAVCENTASVQNCRAAVYEVAFPQYRVDQYVADVAFLRMFHAAPVEWCGPLVVECDGADFHDRDVSQLQRDRKRDRHFQTKGIPVLRFTGSEIYRDPGACVDAIDAWFDADWDRQYRAASEAKAATA